MLDWLIRRRIAAFEKTYGYDMSYARELLASHRKGFWRFARVQPMADCRDGVPIEAWYAAKLAAVRAEDCGPCTQLSVDIAREGGIDDAVLGAVLRNDLAALSSDTALAVRYAQAAVAHAPELMDLRDEVQRRWGPRALASLALSVTAVRMFPMLKYALGHGHACVRVRVGHETIQPPALQPASAHA